MRLQITKLHFKTHLVLFGETSFHYCALSFMQGHQIRTNVHSSQINIC